MAQHISFSNWLYINLFLSIFECSAIVMIFCNDPAQPQCPDHSLRLPSLLQWNLMTLATLFHCGQRERQLRRAFEAADKTRSLSRPSVESITFSLQISLTQPRVLLSWTYGLSHNYLLIFIELPHFWCQTNWEADRILRTRISELQALFYWLFSRENNSVLSTQRSEK